MSSLFSNEKVLLEKIFKSRQVFSAWLYFLPLDKSNSLFIWLISPYLRQQKGHNIIFFHNKWQFEFNNQTGPHRTNPSIKKTFSCNKLSFAKLWSYHHNGEKKTIIIIFHFGKEGPFICKELNVFHPSFVKIQIILMKKKLKVINVLIFCLLAWPSFS